MPNEWCIYENQRTLLMLIGVSITLSIVTNYRNT